MPSIDPFVELLDEARAGRDASARVRQRWLQRQVEEEATLVGTLVDLAETGARVALRSSSGRVNHGGLQALGRDFVLLDGGGELRLVSLASIVSVLPSVGQRYPAAAGDRAAPLDLTLVELLAGLAPDRPRVTLVSGGVALAGELRAVGVDVATLRLDGSPRALCYVATAWLDEAIIERA